MSDDHPLKRFARICSEIGWDKKLSDLSEDEVVGIISNIQLSSDIGLFYEGEYLARIHFLHSDKSWSGGGDATF